MPFNPNEHLIRTRQGNREYLEVKWRLVWLREQAPDAVIDTALIERTDSFALFRAQVTLPSGGRATGYGSETRADFGDFIEKAETKAIGRALAALGFGTQHAAELDEGGSVADSPVEPKAKPATSAAAGAPIAPLPSTNLATHGVMYEQAKGRENPPAPAPKSPDADPDLPAAKAALKTVVTEKRMTWPQVVDLAQRAWPQITTVEDLGLLTTFQLTRLTDVVTGESVIDSGGRIVPAPEHPLIAAKLSAAMR
jgi:hypothetical protein